MKLQIAGAVIALAMFGASSANAGIILTDNFDADALQLNWTGDSTFSPIPGAPVQGVPSVDLIGGASFGELCGGPSTNHCIDLDGSTGSGNNPTGEIQSAMTFAAGHYHLTFTLGGNARGAADQTTVISLGDFTQSISLASADPQTLVTYDFVTTTTGTLNFKDIGPSNQQGNILDNITLASVPEPMTWAMLLVGFFGLGMVMRRRDAALTA
ncbi:MAG TPA: PEP-CTERM sorting domain-containing protein [Rhizomicrobium sp.]|jgi:hypothetical protein|nr:PEP-CTERM sorting domain-containing protein [Rhizomicrobium sp.]